MNLLKIQVALLEEKRAYRWTDTVFYICIQRLSFVQRMHKFLLYVILYNWWNFSVLNGECIIIGIFLTVLEVFEVLSSVLNL